MKRMLTIIALYFCVGSAIATDLSQSEIKGVFKKIIEETITSSKVNDEYRTSLRQHLEKIMYNEQMVSLLMKLSAENSVKNTAEAEKLGFNVMAVLRERALLTLSNDDLYDLMILNISIMNRMTDFECAQYVKKKRTDDENKGRNIYEISGQLSIRDFKKYIGLYDKALSNLFSNKMDSVKLKEDEIIKVKAEFQKLRGDLLAENEFVREFFSSGRSFAESSNSDVCRVSKELYKVIVSGDKVRAKRRASAFINGQLN